MRKQLTNDKTTIRKAFNLKKDRQESVIKAAGDYVAYRESTKYNHRFEEVSRVDEQLSAIMALASAEKRHLTEDEVAKITELKAAKSRLLGIPGTK